MGFNFYKGGEPQYEDKWPKPAIDPKVSCPPAAEFGGKTYTIPFSPGFVGDLEVWDVLADAAVFPVHAGWDLGYDWSEGCDPNHYGALVSDPLPLFNDCCNLELRFTFTAVPEVEDDCEPCADTPCFEFKGSFAVEDHCYKNQDCYPGAVCPPCS